MSLLATVVGLCLASTASAFELTLLTTDRSVYAEGTSFCPGCGPNGEDEVFSNDDGESSNAFGLFDESVTSVGSDASQTSIVSANELSGDGFIGLGATGDNSALSRLLVTFQVPVTDQYAVLGEFTGDFVNSLFISLDSTGGSVFDRQGFGPETFTERFQLLAGETYTLEADASGQDFSGFGRGAGWSFLLVPEPSTALLVGFGLWGLGHRKRDRGGRPRALR